MEVQNQDFLNKYPDEMKSYEESEMRKGAQQFKKNSENLGKKMRMRNRKINCMLCCLSILFCPCCWPCYYCFNPREYS